MQLPALLLACGLGPAAVAGAGKPIVDVRFNADYSQIGASQGDEWAPTWADARSTNSSG
jgi:hypothetical protein